MRDRALKITIVIPSYNSSKWLPHSLKSIFDQGYPLYDVVVADGSSTDGTAQVLKEFKEQYRDRLDVVRMDGGDEVDHINMGIKHATGDVVSWLCADDVYYSGCFTAVALAFERHPTAQWVYGRSRIIDENGDETRQTVTRLKEIFQPHYNRTVLKVFPFIVAPTVFMRKSLCRAVGGYDQNLPLCADYDYWLRSARVAPPVFVNQCLAGWRAHDGSTSVKQFREEMRQAYEVQKRHSRWWLRPLQIMEKGASIKLYEQLTK